MRSTSRIRSVSPDAANELVFDPAVPENHPRALPLYRAITERTLFIPALVLTGWQVSAMGYLGRLLALAVRV